MTHVFDTSRRSVPASGAAGLLILAAFSSGLSACSRGGSGEGAASQSGDERIACQPAGAAAFDRVCTLDRATENRGLVLTVHHPDGKFRRLLVTRDGRGVVAADGAEPAVVTTVGAHEIDVAIAGDHYRLPATVHGSR